MPGPGTLGAYTPRVAAVAESVLRVPNSRIREIAEMAMAMPDVLRLYFGESNLPDARVHQGRGGARARRRATRTTRRTRACRRSARRSPLSTGACTTSSSIPATEIVVTASGVQALHLGIRSLLDPGDEALCLTPGLAERGRDRRARERARRSRSRTSLVGERYVVDFDALEAAVTPRTRLLLYTSPSNPLGWVATRRGAGSSARLRAPARPLAPRGRGLRAALLPRRRAGHAGSVDPAQGDPGRRRHRLRQSFSKTYCMTGWRARLAGLPRATSARKAGPLNEFFVSHATSFIQKAAEAALAEGEGWVREQLALLRANRDLCLAALRDMPGVTVPEPDGAFYLFPRIDGLTDSFEFCRRLLVESRVGLAPGVAFGAGGEGSVRLCYASDSRILEAALNRLERIPRLGRPVDRARRRAPRSGRSVLVAQAASRRPVRDEVAGLWLELRVPGCGVLKMARFRVYPGAMTG